MKQFKIIFIIGILGCISCIGDGVLLVKGNIVDINDMPVSNCILELHLADNSKPLYDKVSIDSKFDIDFVVNPRTKKYFFVIQCGNDFYSYKSEVYEIGGVEYIKNPLNIGKIVLKKKTN